MGKSRCGWCGREKQVRQLSPNKRSCYPRNRDKFGWFICAESRETKQIQQVRTLTTSSFFTYLFPSYFWIILKKTNVWQEFLSCFTPNIVQLSFFFVMMTTPDNFLERGEIRGEWRNVQIHWSRPSYTIFGSTCDYEIRKFWFKRRRERLWDLLNKEVLYFHVRFTLNIISNNVEV